MENNKLSIPAEILTLCNFSKFSLGLTLEGSPAQNRYPITEIRLNHQSVIQQEIVGVQVLHFETNLDPTQTVAELDICYINKQSNDTVVENNQIVENQSLKIQSITINSIDLLDTGLMYRLGYYNMNLPPEKYQHFIQHGFDVGPTHSLHMFENGAWNLKLETPILTYFSKLMATQEKHEKWPDPDLINSIHKRILNIRRLQQLKNTQ